MYQDAITGLVEMPWECHLWFAPITPPVGFGEMLKPIQLPVPTILTGFRAAPKPRH